MIKFLILAGSEYHKTGAIYENALCPYILRLRLELYLLDKRNSSARTCWEGLYGGYKCQLSVKILAICQLSVNWLLIIN